MLELLAWAGGVTEQAGSEIQIFHTQPVLCPGIEEEEELVAKQTPELTDGAQSIDVSQESSQSQAVDQQAEQQTVRLIEPSTEGEFKSASHLSKEANSEEASTVAATESGNQSEDALQQNFKKYLGSFELYSIADLKAGKRAANPIVLPGDVVIVREAATILITGGVIQPSQIALREDMSLLYAIAQAGGLRKDAQGGKVRIFRRITGKLEPEVIKVNYNDIKNQKRPDIALKPYDVIDIPSSVATPSSILNMLLGQGMGVATSVAAGLPLRMMY
ncbi:MAG: SLBB domain-containing protein [Pyrinomonadaceae bacterium]